MSDNPLPNLPLNRPLNKEAMLALATDCEARELLADCVPFAPDGIDAEGNTIYPTGALAEVYTDSDGRLNILLKDGGWLGCKIENLMGDIAPFAG